MCQRASQTFAIFVFLVAFSVQAQGTRPTNGCGKTNEWMRESTLCEPGFICQRIETSPLKTCVWRCDEISNPCNNTDVCDNGTCRVPRTWIQSAVLMMIPLSFCLPPIFLVCYWPASACFRRQHTAEGAEAKSEASLPERHQKCTQADQLLRPALRSEAVLLRIGVHQRSVSNAEQRSADSNAESNPEEKQSGMESVGGAEAGIAPPLMLRPVMVIDVEPPSLAGSTRCCQVEPDHSEIESHT